MLMATGDGGPNFPGAREHRQAGSSNSHSLCPVQGGGNPLLLWRPMEVRLPSTVRGLLKKNYSFVGLLVFLLSVLYLPN